MASSSERTQTDRSPTPLSEFKPLQAVTNLEFYIIY